MSEKFLGDEQTILDEMQETEVGKDWTGIIGTAIICLSMYIPMIIPTMGPFVGWIILFGFVIIATPGILKWKDVATSEFIGSETYFGDGDVYEQFIVEDMMTVVAAAEPFPFAEYCYKEEDLEQYITMVGGKPQVSAEAINERITKAIAERAAEMTAKPSVKGALKFWLSNNRIARRLRREKDTEIYKMSEDVDIDE